MEDPEVWGDSEKAQALGKERQTLEHVIQTFDDIDSGLSDVAMLYELGTEENDENTLIEAVAECFRTKSRDFRVRKNVLQRA